MEYNSPWKKEWKDILRGISGSFLFGVPLLYTVEVWWAGNHTGPFQTFTVLLVTFGFLLPLSRASGFRVEKHYGWKDMLADSVTSLCIGAVAATFSLFMVGVLRPGLDLAAVLGKIALETAPFALGVGISDLILHPERVKEEERNSKDQDGGGLLRDTLKDAGATALGSIIIAFSIAPTEEVQLIASRLSSLWLIGIVAASLLISYMIVFEAAFVSIDVRKSQKGIFQHPFSETAFSYFVSLVIAFVMLWTFQQVSFQDSPEKLLSYTIVLGFPSVIGGAAGRLAV